MTPALALGLSLAAAWTAWRARALTKGGAAAAAAVGFAVLWSAGWSGTAILAAFFIGSTLVGRLGARHPGSSDARGEQRDLVQVIANGAAGALGACAERFQPGLGVWVLTGALAAAAADTWATSLGALSRSDPRHLLHGKQVPRGSSGGVSWIGTFGAVAGSLSVALTAALVTRDAALLAPAMAIGLGGMFLDSLLGASLQARFQCPECGIASERPRHRCGTPTRLAGGWRWLDNDMVNAVTTIAAGTAAGLVWSWH